MPTSWERLSMEGVARADKLQFDLGWNILVRQPTELVLLTSEEGCSYMVELPVEVFLCSSTRCSHAWCGRLLWVLS